MSEALRTDQLTAADMLRLAMRRWILIVTVAVATAVVAAVVAWSLAPVYRGTVVLGPTEEGAGAGMLAELAGQFGALASLSGISIGGQAGAREEAIATLRSWALAAAFIEQHDLRKDLFADDWDAGAGEWRNGREPTMYEAVELFIEDLRRVTDDKRTGLVTLSIDWYDRDAAARWANGLVAAANETLRTRAITEAQRTIDYLERELEKTELLAVREGIYRLIETQINKISVAHVRDEYAFRIIDPAIVPDADRYVRPYRVLMTLAGFLFGALGAMIWVITRHVERADPQQSNGPGDLVASEAGSR